MSFGESLEGKRCGACKGFLIQEGQPCRLAYEDGGWYHWLCLEKAKKALALSMKLARFNQVIACYLENQENIDAPS